MAKVFLTIMNALKQLTVEPYLFFIFFGAAIRLVSFQSLLMDSACRSSFSEDICKSLKNHSDAEKQSINDGNNMYTVLSLVGSLPAIVVAIFFGPWSDKYTRKYPMIISAAGFTLESICSAIIAEFPTMSPLWYIASTAMAGCTGGIIIAASSAYSYLSDITDERSRPARYAVLEFFNIFAIIMGAVIGGQLFKAYNYRSVMIAGPCLLGCALLWVIFMVKETKPKVPDGEICNMFRDMLTVENIKESYKTCTRKRPGNIRMQIWLLVWVSCSQRFVDMGTLAIGFPFSKKMYQWDVTDFSNGSTAYFVVNAIVTIGIVPMLSNKLRLHEAAIGLIGILSLIAKMTVTSVAYQEALFYFGWMSGALGNCAGIATRSRLSKLVHKEELGKAFSLLGTCESVTPVLGTVAFLQIFNISPDSFLGLPFALSIIFLIPSAIIFWWMTKMPTISVGDYGKEDELPKSSPMETFSSNYTTLQEEKY